MSVGWRPAHDDTVSILLSELSTSCGPCEFTGTVDGNLDTMKIENDCPSCKSEQTICANCSEGMMPEVIDLSMGGWNWLGPKYANSANESTQGGRWVNYYEYYKSFPFNPAFCPGEQNLTASASLVANYWNNQFSGGLKLRANQKSPDGLVELGPQACSRSYWQLCPDLFWRIDLKSLTLGTTLVARAVWTYAQIVLIADGAGTGHKLSVTLNFATADRSEILSDDISINDWCETVKTPDLDYDYYQEASQFPTLNRVTHTGSYEYNWRIPSTSCFDTTEFDTGDYLYPIGPNVFPAALREADPHIATVAGDVSTREEPTAIGSGGGIPDGTTIDDYLDAVLADCLGCFDKDTASTFANASADVDGDWSSESNADGDTSGTYADIASGSETGVADTLECKYENLTPLPIGSTEHELESQNLDVWYELISVAGLNVTLDVYVQTMGGAEHLIHTETQTGSGTTDKNTTPQSIDMTEYWKSIVQIQNSTVKYRVSFSSLNVGGSVRIYRSEASTLWIATDS